MSTTRNELRAANTQLAAQLAVYSHQTRNGLRAKLTAARDEAKRLTVANAALAAELDALKARISAANDLEVFPATAESAS